MTRRDVSKATVGVWLLLAAVIAVSVAMSTVHLDTSNPVGPYGMFAADSGDAPLFATPSGVVSPDYTTWDRGQQAAAGRVLAAHDGNPNNDLELFDLLPAHRWRSDVGLYATYGWTEIGEKGQNVLASAAFSVTGFLWAILFALLEAVLSFNVFAGQAGAAINRMYTDLGGAFVSSGLILVPIAAGLITAVARSLKGDSAGTATTLLGVIAPVALLMALINLSGSGDANDGDEIPVGSPVWFAMEGTSVLDDVAGTFGSAFGLAPTVMEYPAHAQVQPSCVSYVNALYGTYMMGAAQSRTTTASAALPIMSRLWERTFVNEWTAAQYGGARGGSRIWCHQFEAQSRVPRAVQAELGVVAGYPSLERSATAALISQSGWPDDIDAGHDRFGAGRMGLDSAGNPITFSFDSDNPSPVGPYRNGERRDPYNAVDKGSGKGYQASLFMWAACVADGGGLRPQTSWAQVGDIDGDKWNHCDVWWQLGLNPGEGPEGDSHERLQWGDNLAGDTAGSLQPGAVANASVPFNPDVHDDLSDLRDVVHAFRGDNSNQRVYAGVISLLTAALYGWALGGIAVGGLIAKVGTAVLLALLPGTLFLLAMPSKGRGRNPVGMRMARMTVGFMAASSFLTFVLVLMISFIAFIETLFDADRSSLLAPFIPFAAVFALRWLLKRSGLGDMVSMRGQVGMATAAGAAAAAPHPALRKFEAQRASQQVQNQMGRPVAAARRAAAVSGQTAAKSGRSVLETARRVNDARIGGDPAEGSDRAGGDPRTREQQMKDMANAAIGDGPLATRMRSLGALALSAGAGSVRGEDRQAENGRSAEWGTQQAHRARQANQRDIDGSEAGRLLRTGEQLADETVIAGVSGEERQRRLVDHHNHKLDDLSAAAQQYIGEDGEPLLGPNGAPVYGFHRVDAAGAVIPGSERTVSAATAGFNPVTGSVAAGYGVQYAPGPFGVSRSAAVAGQTMVAATLGLQPDQVHAPISGIPPMPKLVLPTPNDPSPLPATDSIDGLFTMAGHAEHWIDPGLKQRLMAEGLSPEASARAQASIAIQTGGLDRATGQRQDFLVENGFNIDDVSVQEALTDLVAGKPSVLSELRAPLSGQQFSQIVASAKAWDHQQRVVAERAAEPIVVSMRETVEAAQPAVERLSVLYQVADSATQAFSRGDTKQAATAVVELRSAIPALMDTVQEVHYSTVYAQQAGGLAQQITDTREPAVIDLTALDAAASNAVNAAQFSVDALADSAAGSDEELVRTVREQLLGLIQDYSAVRTASNHAGAGPASLPRSSEFFLAG